MIDSGSFPAALRRGYHYWFRPSGYDSTYDSSQGIVTFGEARRGTTLVSTSLVLSSTTTSTVTLYDDPGFKVGWIIILYAGLSDSGKYMLARITAYDNTDPLNVSLTFQAYQAVGTGTYDYWTVLTQWEQAPNYIQNPQYSARDLSARGYAIHSAQFNWPYDTTYEVVVTSNTDYFKAGYTQATYDAQTIVEEDEYAVNRPYIGITAGSSRVLTTTTDTTTYDYTTDPPTIITTTTTATETKTHSHTYGSDDFDPSGTGYVAGQPAVYADGSLVSMPTPSYQTRRVTLGATYIYSSYDETYEEYPLGSGVFRPTLTIYTSTAWGDSTASPISPPSFFIPG